MCRLPYDPNKHLGEDVSKDPFDGKCWVENQIDWVVKQVRILKSPSHSLNFNNTDQGEEVSAETGVSRHYRLKLELGKVKEPWRGQVVMSTLPAEQLPRSLKQRGVLDVCRLEVALQREDLRRRNHRWYNLSREYWLADFDVRILIGPADLRFLLVGADGTVRNDGKDTAVTVEWESPKRASALS